MKKNCLVVVSGCTVLRAQDRVRRVEEVRTHIVRIKNFGGERRDSRRRVPTNNKQLTINALCSNMNCNSCFLKLLSLLLLDLDKTPFFFVSFSILKTFFLLSLLD